MPEVMTALNTNFLKPVDLKCIALLVLSFTTFNGFKSNEPSFNIPSLLSVVRHGDENNHLSSDDLGMRVVSTLFKCAIDPRNDRDKQLGDLWRHCVIVMQSSGHESCLNDFLLKILLHTMPAKADSPVSLPISLEEVFDLWSYLAKDLNSKLSVEVCGRLEAYLTASFVSLEDGRGTWAVYQRICKQTPEKFVNLCLSTLLTKMVFDVDNPSNVSDDVKKWNNASFLPAVIGYDCSEFTCLTSMIVRMASDDRILKLWTNGCLDLTAATFVLQIYAQKSTTEIRKTSFHAQAANMIGKRFLCLLSDEVSVKKYLHGA